MDNFDANIYDPFKLGRDANWVIHVFALFFWPWLCFIAPPALTMAVIAVPVSLFALWNALSGPGNYGCIDGRLRGVSFKDRLMLGMKRY